MVDLPTRQVEAVEAVEAVVQERPVDREVVAQTPIALLQVSTGAQTAPMDPRSPLRFSAPRLSMAVAVAVELRLKLASTRE